MKSFLTITGSVLFTVTALTAHAAEVSGTAPTDQYGVSQICDCAQQSYASAVGQGRSADDAKVSVVQNCARLVSNTPTQDSTAKPAAATSATHSR
jgi:hypothetical protein